MRRKRRYSTKIKKKKFNTTYQQGNTQSTPAGSKKTGKIFLSIILFIAISVILKYIYDLQNFGEDNSPDQSIDTTVTQMQHKPDNKEEKTEQISPIRRNLQIEILNGCGINGIAKIFAEYLRQEGYDVINTDNYKEKGKTCWNLPKSKVIDQINKPQFAEKIAEKLGISLNQVITKDNPQAIYDITVVIGKDFRKLKGFQKFKR